MIEVRNMTKKYDGVAALKDVSLDLHDGEILALIGYNGSGKTTLLKTMAGIFRAEAGTIRADGRPVFENEAFKRRAFLLPDLLYFPPHSRLSDVGRCYRGYYPAWDEGLFQALIALAGLRPETPARVLSKGMRRQAGLAVALAASPDHLFLDETFDGLDWGRRQLLRRMLERYAAQKNAAVVVTSHYFQEMSVMADRIAMLRDGCLSLIGEGVRSEAALEGLFEEKIEESLHEIDKLFDGRAAAS
jgi:ABC-2 type transport system ATP-binding protein